MLEVVSNTLDTYGSLSTYLAKLNNFNVKKSFQRRLEQSTNTQTRQAALQNSEIQHEKLIPQYRNTIGWCRLATAVCFVFLDFFCFVFYVFCSVLAIGYCDLGGKMLCSRNTRRPFTGGGDKGASFTGSMVLTSIRPDVPSCGVGAAVT